MGDKALIRTAAGLGRRRRIAIAAAVSLAISCSLLAPPASAQSTVEIPLRVAVVQGGVQEKTIATKVSRPSVSMTEAGSEPFSLVAEELVYPTPVGAVGDSYIFYIGFDPQALTPEPKP